MSPLACNFRADISLLSSGSPNDTKGGKHDRNTD